MYKSMYLILFKSISSVIEILTKALQDAEECYINYNNDNIVKFNDEEKEGK